MHTVVCIKQVPDTQSVRINPETNALIREGVPSIINPHDLHAIEEALRIKDRFGGRVSVISMCPPQGEKSLKKAISYGIDEAYLLCDRAFAGADTLATTYALAQAIKKLDEIEKVKLIFCGTRAIDGETGQVGPGLATRLGFSQLTYITSISDLDIGNQEITVIRKTERAREKLKAPLPALITLRDEANEIRYSSLKDLVRAERYKVIFWPKTVLNIDESQTGFKGSPTKVHKTYVTPAKERGEIYSTEDRQEKGAVDEVIEKLIKTGFFVKGNDAKSV
ncbi:MAG: electron transfer flavoprotein subunit beta/FixA family protein [Actinobacteria bacterium]|nr:electron transfer flavoprotein subunit beta/FixA family protein [Actinomycetota bacterium]